MPRDEWGLMVLTEPVKKGGHSRQRAGRRGQDPVQRCDPGHRGLRTQGGWIEAARKAGLGGAG